MKLIQLFKIHQALSSLSGSVTHLHEGKPIQVAYRFTGLTRLAIAKTIRLLSPFIEDHKEASKAIVKQHGGPWESACPEQEQAISEIYNLENSEVGGVPSFTFPETEFIHDDNPIPPAVLETLLDHLK